MSDAKRMSKDVYFDDCKLIDVHVGLAAPGLVLVQACSGNIWQPFCRLVLVPSHPVRCSRNRSSATQGLLVYWAASIIESEASLLQSECSESQGVKQNPSYDADAILSCCIR